MRALWVSGLALVIAALVGVVLVGPHDTKAASVQVRFGLVGDPADPPAGAGGSTRDRNEPGNVVIRRGDTVDFLNRSGGMHQVAVYGAGLNYDQPGCGAAASPCNNLTVLSDITVLPGPLPWGNWIAPPDGSIAKDDPATLMNESRAGAGMIALGPNPTGVTVPARQAGAVDFSYTFSMPGQYLVICNFTPHFVNYAQSTFVLVTD